MPIFKKLAFFCFICDGFLVHQGELKKCRPTVRPKKKKISIYAQYRKSPINTLGDFLNLWSAQLLISLFWSKIKKWIAVCDAFFMGYLPVTFCYFCFWNLFLVSTSKKRCDGRRKTKIKKLTLKNKCEKIKKAARAATLTTYKWFEYAVRPLISKISLARKLGFVHLIQIIHLVLRSPYGHFLDKRSNRKFIF